MFSVYQNFRTPDYIVDTLDIRLVRTKQGEERQITNHESLKMMMAPEKNSNDTTSQDDETEEREESKMITIMIE